MLVCPHSEVSKPEEALDNFKCDLCKKDYNGRANFMRHKKLIHPEFVPSCEKFSVGKCARGEKECWFEHKAIKILKVDEKSWPKIVQKSKTKPDASSGSIRILDFRKLDQKSLTF